MKSKRGLEMAISTLIVIILSIMVLIALVFVFSKSTGGFKDRVFGFFSNSNVDDVVRQCNSEAEQERYFDYCCANKTIKISSKVKFENTCFNISNENYASEMVSLNCGGVC